MRPGREDPLALKHSPFPEKVISLGIIRKCLLVGVDKELTCASKLAEQPALATTVISAASTSDGCKQCLCLATALSSVIMPSSVYTLKAMRLKKYSSWLA